MATAITKTTVKDVMTEHVHVLSEATPFKAIVRLIEDNRISGLPVVDMTGRVVGVVSEADLLLKEERGHLKRGRLGLESRRHRVERNKASGLKAGDLMTSPAMIVGGEASLAEAARLLHENHVKRLPVVDDDGRIIGIVSRSDLLTVFLRSDREIRAEVQVLVTGTLWLDAAVLEITVEDGVVHLAGRLPRRSDTQLLVALAGRLEGVVAVEPCLDHDWDDTQHRPSPILAAEG
jgi:CBS domain-containing protein